MQLIVDSLMTSFVRQSDSKKDTILILHGWNDSASGWKALQMELAKTYDTIALDLPGFGGTQVPPVPWGLDEYAAFVASFLDKINVDLHTLIAHSNSGAIAIRGLARGSFQTEKLILIASAGVRNERQGRKKTLQLIAKTGKILTYPLPARLKQMLRRQLYDSVGSEMLIAEHMQETFKRVVADDVQADAARLRVPTLLVYGEDDTATPVRYGRAFQHLIPGSQLAVIPAAGHFVHRDQPDKVNACIHSFCDDTRAT